MAQPMLAGSQDMWATGSFASPDPVNTGSAGWTWDMEFPPAGVYARSSLNRFSLDGGAGYLLSGIVEYTTRNADGSDTVHAVGSGDPDGLADFAWDSNVDSVTFGWAIFGSAICNGNINFEIWS